ncbi:MAG: LysM peptidoglycan-binding domain-containing protein, partial [Anaerolineae bacterium]|nr:LysM peptidoglycan-binding domain-containing protein [Anaerolineae bacterium]
MSLLKKHTFTFLSWFFTFIIVSGILFLAYKNKDAFAGEAPPQIIEITATPPGSNNSTETQEFAPETSTNNAIRRKITLKTLIPTDRPNYGILQYTVSRGDSTFSISEEFNIEPETILWANYDTLEDNPHNLRVGQELNIPPVNGIYYKWEEDDTIENIAYEFDAEIEDIISFS